MNVRDHNRITSKSSSRRKNYYLFPILVIILFLMIIISIRIGWIDANYLEIYKALLSGLGFGIPVDAQIKKIILDIRLPRIAMDILLGASLSVSGCAMQAIFRNPLASPFVTGIASGGAFGAAFIIILGLPAILAGPSAFIFSVITAFFVYFLAMTNGNVPVGTMILAGIAVSLFFSALLSFVQYIADERQLREIVLWSMGRVWEADWTKVLYGSAIISIGIFAVFMLTRELDILLLGDKTATSLGVNTAAIRRTILVLVSLLTATAVAIGGVISFVGLVVPHIMRMLIGPGNRMLVPASALAGSIFMIMADSIAKIIIAPVELPVGIITSIIGVPFFLYILKSRKKKIGFSGDT